MGETKKLYQDLIENSKALGFTMARLAITNLAIEVAQKLKEANIKDGTYGVIYTNGVTDTFKNIENALNKAELEIKNG